MEPVSDGVVGIKLGLLEHQRLSLAVVVAVVVALSSEGDLEKAARRIDSRQPEEPALVKKHVFEIKNKFYFEQVCQTLLLGQMKLCNDSLASF